MAHNKMAVVGIGATGTVLAAALLARHPETVLVGRTPETGKILVKDAILASGALALKASVRHYTTDIQDLAQHDPQVIFLAVKTFHLDPVLNELEKVYRPGMKIISMQNGLGPEDRIASRFGKNAALRLSLNYGASLVQPGNVTVNFFNKPNHLGVLAPEERPLGLEIAQTLTRCGLDTELVDDIRLNVWKKMIMKCTMAAICAVTNLTIREALDYPPARQVADACFAEALAVAQAQGYDLGENYLGQALGYLEKVGAHKDSICYDIEKKTPTEIDFLGAKVVDYARQKGVPVPFYTTMTAMVKAIEHGYLKTEKTEESL